MIKKFTSLFLALCFVLTCGFTSVSAATMTPVTEEELVSCSARSGNTMTLTLQRTSATSGIMDMGFAPTVTVRGTGNPNAYYKVTVINPIGIVYRASELLCADGSSVTINMPLSPGGKYQVHVQVWEGVTSGELVTFVITES